MKSGRKGTWVILPKRSLLNFFFKSGIVENIYIGVTCSPYEIKLYSCLDPLKVEAIVNLPPLSSLHQLQSLQGKANFLHR